MFWNQKGVIMLEFMVNSIAVNFVSYRSALSKLEASLCAEPHLKVICFCNMRIHGSNRCLKIRETITVYGRTALLNLLYRPDHVLSGFHLLHPLKDTFRGQKFYNDQMRSNFHRSKKTASTRICNIVDVE